MNFDEDIEHETILKTHSNLLFQRLEKKSYSNFGYWLQRILSKIIEHATERNYIDCI